MRRRHCNSDLDKLSNQLLKMYSEQITTADADNYISTAPYFLAQLRNKIATAREYQEMNVWEYSVVSAQKWLFAFSLLAALFFVGNLLVFALNPSFPSLQSTYSIDFEYGDYSEESLNVYDSQQE